MPDQIVLHVGPHKTGSTAIQRMLKASRIELSDQGIAYPRSGSRMAGHHLIVLHCEGSAVKFDPVEIRAETAQASIVVISSENFAISPAAALDRFRALFPGTPIRVIYYLRCLCDLWPSHWQETIKHGLTLPFPEYAMRLTFGQNQPKWADANQLEQLVRLSSVFGREAVEIVGYDHLRAKGIDIGVHFQTEILGRKAEDVRGPSPTANASLDPWQVELLRVLNAIHRSRVTAPPGDALRIRVLELLEREEPLWLNEFKDLVAASPRFELDSQNPCLELLQHRVLAEFESAIIDQREAAAAYCAPRRRKVPLFEWPFASKERLRRALMDYHLDVIGAADLTGS